MIKGSFEFKGNQTRKGWWDAWRPSNRRRDDSAKLRGLASELGLTLEELPNRDTWRLVDDATGEAVINPEIEATGFRTPDAIRLMQKLERERAKPPGPPAATGDARSAARRRLTAAKASKRRE